ncbi:conserved hypothetical protein [Ricinus communis]|uniref:Uncharacterized protein n=1 Tax=Ricinus communis TaxID=3988 RepID=B9R8U6_RICCO|nr:conserved hypothetical protein [Ricinus communis]
MLCVKLHTLTGDHVIVTNYWVHMISAKVLELKVSRGAVLEKKAQGGELGKGYRIQAAIFS